MMGGYTLSLPEDDRTLQSKAKFEDDLAGMLGGRAAEEVAFDEITTGAGNDIDVATDMARKMVTQWGMSDRVGPLSYSSGNNNPFPNGQGGQQRARPYSESVAKEIDAEVKRIVTDQYQRAHQILQANYELLELMAEGLLEFEALDREEIEVLLQEESLEAVRRLREREARQTADEEDTDRVPKTDYDSEIEESQDGPAPLAGLSPSTNS